MDTTTPSGLNDAHRGSSSLPPRDQSAVRVRRALPADAGVVLALVRGLADYENLPPPDTQAQQRLVRDMFAQPPRINALLAEIQGAPAGYAFYFETYSSFLARPTLYLEDIFVKPEFRGKKAGIALFRFLVQEALERGCGRMEWVVLDWNTLALDFYSRLGAKHMKDWQIHRLEKEEMEAILSRYNFPVPPPHTP